MNIENKRRDLFPSFFLSFFMALYYPKMKTENQKLNGAILPSHKKAGTILPSPPSKNFGAILPKSKIKNGAQVGWVGAPAA